MDTKTEEKTNTATQNLPESPASVNTRIKSARGFVYQWTMRDEKNKNLLYKIEEMEKTWIDHGFTPVDTQTGFKRQDTPKVTKPCTIHNAEMTQKASKKSGKLYFSHYIGQFPNGTMCFGQDDRNTQPDQTRSNYPQLPQDDNYPLWDIDF